MFFAQDCNALQRYNCNIKNNDNLVIDIKNTHLKHINYFLKCDIWQYKNILSNRFMLCNAYDIWIINLQ